MNSKIIVFDMDDTLVDSHLRYEKGIFKPLNEAGIAYDHAEMIAKVNPLGVQGTAAYFSALGVPGTLEEIAERLLLAQEAFYREEVVPAVGAEAYLRTLQAEHARLFLLTATPHRLADPCLRHLGLYDLFEQVWCTEDFGYFKTQPQLYTRVAAAIGCAPEDILFFDDGAAAIRTAHEAGWRTCGVCPSYAVTGVGMAEVADRCIVTFEELL